MSIKETEMLEQQRQRRKRINKMKSVIIMTISIWMIVSFLAIVILSVQVIRLSIRVKHLEHGDSNKTVIDTQINNDTNVPEQDTEKNAVVNNEIDTDKIVKGVDTDDNNALAGDEHKVYLTFDCEPSENTELILDYLKENNIKATFFVSGNDSEESIAICKRIVDEGHTIGMHSYSNRYSSIYSSKEAFNTDLKEIDDYILNSTGMKSVYYRFPGGSSNKISNVEMAEFVKILNDSHITYFDWNVSAGDSSEDYSVDDVVNNVITGSKKYKTSVVLLHDSSNKSTTAEAINPLISALKDMNADILPIDENTYVVQYIKADSVE